VQSYGAACGTFGNAQFTVGDQGPLQVALIVERSYGANKWQQQFVLRRGESELLVRNFLTWLEPWRMVKLSCDVNTQAPTAVHDVPFGFLARPCDGHEVPTHMWMDVSGPAATAHPEPAQAATGEQMIGLAVLNDGKYGCDVMGSSMRLTILRCVPYAYHEPHPFGVRGRYDWVDLGSQSFTFVLRPHAGDWRNTDVVARARSLNQPPLAVTMHAHGGDMTRAGSLYAIDSADVEVTACKRADDGNGYIVRLLDVHGRGARPKFTWQQASISLEIAPFEAVTLRITPDGDTWRLERCNMLEQ
jgi:alpha-mannosidase